MLPPSLCLSQNAIHSHIRLFEPLVIKALKQYTTTTSVRLQKQVLDLLAQLVQLRVNYCLLDSDQVCTRTAWPRPVTPLSGAPVEAALGPGPCRPPCWGPAFTGSP